MPRITKKQLEFIISEMADTIIRSHETFNKSKVLTEEHKNKIKQASLGKEMSEEAKKNISKGKKGKPWTEARRLAQKKKSYEGL